MFIRILATILGFGFIYFLGSEIIEKKTFDWIYLPVGWVCAVFVVYGVFGLDITKLRSQSDSKNAVEHSNKSEAINPSINNRSKWLSGTRTIGFIGLALFFLQITFYLLSIWSNIEWVGTGELITRVSGFIFMLIFLFKIGNEFFLNKRYSNTLKIGLVLFIVFSLVAGFLFAYIYLLWYCTKEIQYELLSNKDINGRIIAR